MTHHLALKKKKSSYPFCRVFKMKLENLHELKKTKIFHRHKTITHLWVKGLTLTEDAVIELAKLLPPTLEAA